MKLVSKLISAFEAVYLHVGMNAKYWDAFPLSHELQVIWEITEEMIFYSYEHENKIEFGVADILPVMQSGIFRGKKFTLIAIEEEGLKSCTLFDNSKEIRV